MLDDRREKQLILYPSKSPAPVRKKMRIQRGETAKHQDYPEDQCRTSSRGARCFALRPRSTRVMKLAKMLLLLLLLLRAVLGDGVVVVVAKQTGRRRAVKSRCAANRHACS